MNGPIPNRWSPYLLSVLRIIAAFTFISHGTQKLLAFPVLEPRDPVPLLSMYGLAGVLESVGGLLLFLGLFTRPVAFLLAGHMAFCVLHRACAERLLASAEWGGSRGAVLLHLAVSRRGGARALEPRCPLVARI